MNVYDGQVVLYTDNVSFDELLALRSPARDLGSKYATLVIARLQSDGALEYLNCAHVPPRIYRGSRHSAGDLLARGRADRRARGVINLE